MDCHEGKGREITKTPSMSWRMDKLLHCSSRAFFFLMVFVVEQILTTTSMISGQRNYHPRITNHNDKRKTKTQITLQNEALRSLMSNVRGMDATMFVGEETLSFSVKSFKYVSNDLLYWNVLFATPYLSCFELRIGSFISDTIHPPAIFYVAFLHPCLC